MCFPLCSMRMSPILLEVIAFCFIGLSVNKKSTIRFLLPLLIHAGFPNEGCYVFFPFPHPCKKFYPWFFPLSGFLSLSWFLPLLLPFPLIKAL